MELKKNIGIYHWEDLLEEILLFQTDRQSRKCQRDRQTAKEVAGTLQRGQAIAVPDKDRMAEVFRSSAVASQGLGWMHSISLLKLSGANEKETLNVQQTCLGVY